MVIGRLLDLLTTYLAGKGSLSCELNILVSVFNLGWKALIFQNIIVISLAFYFLKIQSDMYYSTSEDKITNKKIPFLEYFSVLYFGKKISFMKSLTTKIKYKITIHSLIQISLISIIILSFFISINNLLAGNGYVNLYSYKNRFYHNYILQIINFLIFASVTFLYHYKKYILFLKINGDK